LVYKISGVTVNFGNTGSSTRLNRVVGVNDVDINPFIDGKFGLIRDLYIGNDLTDSQPVQATSVPTPLKTIVTVCDDGAGNNFVWGFSDPRKGFIYLSDPGWLSGHTTTYASSDTRYPLYLNGSNYPAAKPTPYSFAGSCQTSAQQVWNSVLFANILAWAVDYAAAHRDVTLNAQP
jgi:hypothetical protein